MSRVLYCIVEPHTMNTNTMTGMTEKTYFLDKISEDPSYPNGVVVFGEF